MNTHFIFLYLPLIVLSCRLHCAIALLWNTLFFRRLPPPPTKDNVGITLPTSARPNIVQVGGWRGLGEALLHCTEAVWCKGYALIWGKELIKRAWFEEETAKRENVHRVLSLVVSLKNQEEIGENRVQGIFSAFTSLRIEHFQMLITFQTFLNLPETAQSETLVSTTNPMKMLSLPCQLWWDKWGKVTAVTRRAALST